MYIRQRQRDLDSTVLIDLKLTHVKPKLRTTLVRDVSAAAIPADGRLNASTIGLTEGSVVGIPATKRMLYIKVAHPVLIRAGDITFVVENAFCINGTFPAFSLERLEHDVIAAVHQY